MKSFKFLIITAILLFSVSQNVVLCQTPSVDLSAVAQIANQPIIKHNHYTGTASITIPIWVAQSKGLSLPISIDYNTSGIRVNQIASAVGMGWQLNAGGGITRSVRGLPDDTYHYVGEDDHTNEFGWIFNDPDDDLCAVPNTDPNCANLVQDIDLTDDAELLLMSMIEVEGQGWGGKQDTEPDIFYINCGTISGSFVIGPGEDDDDGEDHEILLIPYQNIKVSYTLDETDKNIDEFKVIDSDGTIYYFNILETTRTNSKTLTRGDNPSTNFKPISPIGPIPKTSTQSISYDNGEISCTDSTDRQFVSSWFLEKIITNQNEVINFEYEDEWQCLDTSFHNTYLLDENNNDVLVSEVIMNYLEDDAPPLLKSKRISKISSDQFQIDFSYNSIVARDDINHSGVTATSKYCRSLESINIYKGNNDALAHIKKVEFETDYYDYNESTNEYLNEEYGRTRLFLESIQETSGGNSIPAYTFDYNSPGGLPSRFSYAQDFWGYHNGDEDNTSLIPKIYIYPSLSGSDRFRLFEDNDDAYGTEYTISGANRLPDINFNPYSDHMQDGILYKISFPTGGYAKFEYEPHKFEDPSDPGTYYQGSGLRVSRKTLNDGSKNIIEDYVYDSLSPIKGSGKPISLPIFGLFDPPEDWPSPDSDFYKQNYLRSNNNMADLSEGTVGYGVVQIIKVKNPEENNYETNGKIVYYYANNATYRDSNYTDDLYELTPVIINNRWGDYSLTYTPRSSLPHLNLASYSYPYPPNTNFSWNRGYIEKLEVRDSDNNVVIETINDYKYYFQNGTSPEILYGLINGFLTYNYSGDGITGYEFPLFASGKYEILTQMRLLLESTTEKVYDPESSSNYLTNSVSYEYNDYAQLATAKYTDSKGIHRISMTRFVPDLYTGETLSNCDTATQAIKSMWDRNIIDIPIESISLYKNPDEEESKVIGASVQKYLVKDVNNDSFVLPHHSYILETDNPIDSSNFEFSTIDSDVQTTFEFDSKYKKQLSFQEYDDQGNLQQIHSKGAPRNAFIWDNKTHLLAKVSNAFCEEIGGEDFENFNNSEWTLQGSNIDVTYNSNAKSGDTVLYASGISKIFRFFTITTRPLNTQNGYTASAWINGDDQTKLRIEVPSSSYSDEVYVSGSGWNIYTVELSSDDLDNLQAPINIKVTIEVTNSNQEALVDDIRFYPSDALIQTYTFDTAGQVVSTSGVNNKYRYFEYDDWGRLFLTYDDDKYILSRNTYTINSSGGDILSQIILSEGITSANQIDDLSLGKKLDTRAYFDGFGRITQKIFRQYSPNQKDFVQAYFYDNLGRDTIAYLPYASSETTGTEKSGVISEIEDFYIYSPRVAHTPFPYYEKEFEDSPLNILSELGSVGVNWQISNEHTKKFGFTLNANNQIVKFLIKRTTGGCEIDENDMYYSSNDLIIKKSTDENSRSVFLCVDKSGKTITKFVELDSEEYLYTYYVYDTIGRLRYLIPPEAFNEMGQTGGSYDFDWNDQFTDDYIYCFQYDKKGRLIEKKVPGKETEYLIYDNLNRITMSQDGNLRNDDLWNFVKYDVYGRIVTTGLYDAGSTISRSSMQTNADNFYAQNPGYNHELCVPFTQKDEGYSFRSYPNAYSNAEVLNVKYYDDYRFDESSNYTYQNEPKMDLPSNPSYRIDGFSTGVKTKILDSSPAKWLYTVFYYDENGRLIQRIADNHLNGKDIVSNELLFDGKLNQTKHTHDVGSNSTEQFRRFSYDHAGRVMNLKYGINTQSKFLMYANKFNEIGQVIERNLHSEDNGVSFWQSIDLKYNIRGWLTHINQSNLYNNNNIINYNEYLDDDEMVNGLIYDSIIFVIDTVRNNVIEIDIYDYKSLYITEIDDTSSHRNLSLNENQLVVMEEEESDSTEFHSLKSMTGDSIIFNLKGYFFDKYTEQNIIIDSIEAIVKENLIELGYTDTNITAAVNQKIAEFTKSRVALVYFNEDSDDLFGMDICYQEGFTTLNGDPQYNGTISGIRWQTAYNTGIRGYGYGYDELYQLTDAEYGDKGQNGWDSENKYGVFDITYDRNGNITDLNRNGLQRYNGSTPEFGLIDDLEYSYNGNQLDAVNDDTDGITFQSNDFRDNSSTGSDEYDYDDNGNLISDDNKGITQIKYNHLNLPTEIKFDATHKIEFTYDARGRKLKKKITSGSNITTIDYIGNFIYENSSAKFILTEEGRMVPEEGTGDYLPQYFLRDHLGNIRVCITDTDSDGDADVIQENHFYPYGMTMGDLNYVADVENKYLYQGKENIDDLSLYWYEFGARMFDQQIGRWHVVDPVTQFASPYNGMGNNPASMIDPKGTIRIWFIRQIWEHGHIYRSIYHPDGIFVGYGTYTVEYGSYWVDDPLSEAGRPGHDLYSGYDMHDPQSSGSGGGGGSNEKVDEANPFAPIIPTKELCEAFFDDYRQYIMNLDIFIQRITTSNDPDDISDMLFSESELNPSEDAEQLYPILENSSAVLNWVQIQVDGGKINSYGELNINYGASSANYEPWPHFSYSGVHGYYTEPIMIGINGNTYGFRFQWHIRFNDMWVGN